MPRKKVEKQVVIDDLPRTKGLNKSKKLSLSLPIPVSVNHAYINMPGGGRRLSLKAEQWVRYAKQLASEAIKTQKWRTEIEGAWLICDMTFYFPDNRIRDNHNSFKLMFDALEDIIYQNDRFVLPRVNACYLDRKCPRIELTFYLQK